jgi:hypothetical protein
MVDKKIIRTIPINWYKTLGRASSASCRIQRSRKPRTLNPPAGRSKVKEYYHILPANEAILKGRFTGRMPNMSRIRKFAGIFSMNYLQI